MKSSKKILSLLILAPFFIWMTACQDEGGKGTTAQGDTLRITVLQTADIHGQLDTHPELFWEDEEIVFKNRGGLANIKTLFDQERAANPGRTIIVDGGDLIQGSGYAALSQGKVMMDIIKEMGYDVIIPGNWEVVYGKESMMEIMQGYDTKVIAQNMYHDETGERLFPAYWIQEIEGVKLGFVGLNDPAVPIRQNPSFSEGISFSDMNKEFKATLDRMKEEEGVDILFLVTHIGVFKQFALGNSPIASSVDYILGNDTHERVRELLQGKYAKVSEPGAFGSFVGKLILKFVDGEFVGDEYELIDVDPDVYAPDEVIQGMVNTAKAPYQEELETVIGYTNTPLYRYLTVENPLDNMITDAARWKTGVDISLSNGFRFGNPIVPEKGKPAAITKANLWNLLPVNEKVKTGRITGQQLREWLEQEMHNAFAAEASDRFGGWLVRFSGMRVKFNSENPKGQRIEEITVNGKPFADDEFYTISACVRPGDPLDRLCRMPYVKDVQVMSYTIHDVMEEYLKVFSPVAPVLDGRAYSEPLGVYSFSTVPGTDYVFH